MEIITSKAEWEEMTGAEQYEYCQYMVNVVGKMFRKWSTKHNSEYLLKMGEYVTANNAEVASSCYIGMEELEIYDNEFAVLKQMVKVVSKWCRLEKGTPHAQKCQYIPTGETADYTLANLAVNGNAHEMVLIEDAIERTFAKCGFNEKQKTYVRERIYNERTQAEACELANIDRGRGDRAIATFREVFKIEYLTD